MLIRPGTLVWDPNLSSISSTHSLNRRHVSALCPQVFSLNSPRQRPPLPRSSYEISYKAWLPDPSLSLQSAAPEFLTAQWIYSWGYLVKAIKLHVAKSTTICFPPSPQTWSFSHVQSLIISMLFSRSLTLETCHFQFFQLPFPQSKPVTTLSHLDLWKFSQMHLFLFIPDHWFKASSDHGWMATMGPTVSLALLSNLCIHLAHVNSCLSASQIWLQ